MRLTEEKLSACTLDCPDGCSILVRVFDQNVVSMRGNPSHPITRGFICSRPSNLLKMSKDGNRLLYPTLREKGKRRRISWAKAFEIISERLAPIIEGRSNGFAIQGTGSTGITKYAARHLFRLIGFQEPYGSLCDEAGIEAFFLDTGELDMSDPRQLLRAGGIILWGKIPTASTPHTAALVMKAVRGGIPLAVVSPRRIPLSAYASLDIRIRPGEDASLAALTSHWLISENSFWKGADKRSENFQTFCRKIMDHNPENLRDRADVDATSVRALADFLLGNRPVSVIVAQGLQRYKHGCAAVRTINALTFISGNMGKRGSGSFYNLPSSRNLNLDWMAPSVEKKISLPRISREFTAHLDNIQFAWIGATNLANQVPDALKAKEALKRISFTVVAETVWNDTAEIADLALPAASMLERTDITSSFGHDFLSYSHAVVDPPGEALSDYDIIMKLALYLGLSLQWKSLEEYFSIVLDSPFLQGGLSRLEEKGFVRAKRPYVAYRQNVFPRPGGKFKFLENLPVREQEDEYPLYFLTTVQHRYQHSQIPPKDQEKPMPVRVHPRTAEKFGLADGKPVFIKSPLGLMPAVLRFDRGLHPDVVLAPRGGWLKMGRGANAIIAPFVSEEGHTAAYYHQKVTLLPA